MAGCKPVIHGFVIGAMCLNLRTGFCAFHTETQTSTGYFHQFCILTKISIEILSSFVYNVLIAVLSHLTGKRKGHVPSRKEI